jgi:hypothetical protein
VNDCMPRAIPRAEQLNERHTLPTRVIATTTYRMPANMTYRLPTILRKLAVAYVLPAL